MGMDQVTKLLTVRGRMFLLLTTVSKTRAGYIKSKDYSYNEDPPITVRLIQQRLHSFPIEVCFYVQKITLQRLKM